MAELFPSTMPADILQGYYGMKNMQEDSAQRAMKSQLMNLDIAREQAAQQELQAGAPLREQQRGLQMEQVQGQRQQLPFTQQRELALSQAAADPQRLLQDVESGDLESAAKVRAGKMRKQADEMDLHIQGYGPVLQAMKSGDYEGQNSAWDSYFKLLDDNGVDTREMRVTPRDQLIPRLNQQYQQAINTAPAIRERIKADEAHKRRLEEIAAQEKARAATARERLQAGLKPPTKPEGAVARAMEKYRKDVSSLNPQEAQMVRDWYETNMSEQDQVDYEWAYNNAEREAIRRRHMARITRAHPKLYKLQPSVSNQRPPAEIYRRFGLEPPKK